MLKTYGNMLLGIQQNVIVLANKIIDSNRLVLQTLDDKDFSKYDEARNLLRGFSKHSNELDNQIVRVLALYSPEAKDLREVVAYLKITNELNRAAIKTRKYIKNISQNIDDELFHEIILTYTIPMHKETIAALEHSISIISTEEDDEMKFHLTNTELAENQTGQLYTMIEKSMFHLMCELNNDTKEYLDVLISLRGLDKIADRALSIAKLLVYAKVGGELE